MLQLPRMVEAVDHLLTAVAAEGLLQSEVVGEGHHPVGAVAVAVVGVHLQLQVVAEVVEVHPLSKAVVVVVVVVGAHHPS